MANRKPKAEEKNDEPLVAVAERISKANPAAGRALQTAADRRRYARRMAGWPEEKGN